MLREEKVVRLTFDASSDSLLIEAAAALPGALDGKTRATLLLDGSGFLVGVDVGEEPERRVLMAGRHEDVARTVESDVVVRGTTLRLANATKQVHGDRKNPYV